MDTNNPQKCNGFTKEAKLYQASDAADCSLYAGFYSEDEFWCCDLYDAFGGYVCEVGTTDKPAECCYASSEETSKIGDVKSQGITFKQMACGTCVYTLPCSLFSDCSSVGDGFTKTGSCGYGTFTCSKQVEDCSLGCPSIPDVSSYCQPGDCPSPEPTPELSGDPLPTPTPTPSEGCQDDTDCGACERCNTFNHQCYSIDEVECTDCEECDPSTRSCKSKTCGRCYDGLWQDCKNCEQCNDNGECVPAYSLTYPQGCYTCDILTGEWIETETETNIRKNCLVCRGLIKNSKWEPEADSTNQCYECDGNGTLISKCSQCEECLTVRLEDGSDFTACYKNYATECYDCEEIDLEDGTKSRKLNPKGLPDGHSENCYKCSCAPEYSSCDYPDRYWQPRFDEKQCESCNENGVVTPNPKCQECDNGTLIDKYKDSCCYQCDPLTGWIYKRGEDPPKNRFDLPENNCQVCIESDYDGELYKGKQTCVFFDKCKSAPFGDCYRCQSGACKAEYTYGGNRVEECPQGSTPDNNCECDKCNPACDASRCMQCYSRDGVYVCDKNEEWLAKLASDPCAKCLNGQVLSYQEYITHPDNLKEVKNPWYEVCKDPRTVCSDGQENEKILLYKGCLTPCKEIECNNGVISCNKDKTDENFPNCAGCVDGKFERAYERCEICQKCETNNNNSPECVDLEEPDNPCEIRIVIQQQCQTVDKCKNEFPNLKPVSSKIFTVDGKSQCKCVGDFCGEGADEEGSFRPASDYCDPGHVCCRGRCVKRINKQAYCHVKDSEGCTRSESMSGDSCQIQALCADRGGELKNSPADPCDNSGRPPSSSGGDDVVDPYPSTNAGGNGAPITAAPITAAPPIITGSVTPPGDGNNPIVGPGAGGDNGLPIGNDPPDPGGEVPPQITASEVPGNPGNPVLPPSYGPGSAPSDPGNPSVPPSPRTNGGDTEPGGPPTTSPPEDPEYPDIPANATATIPGVNPPTIPPGNPNNPELPPTLPPTTDYPLPDPPTDPDNPDYPYTSSTTGSTTSETPVTDPVACPQDVRRCPDGSYVNRDPFNGCLFRECPSSQTSTSATTVPYLSSLGLGPVILGGLGGVGTVSTLPQITDMPVVYGGAGTQDLTTGPTLSSSSSGPVVLGGPGGTEGITSGPTTSGPTTSAVLTGLTSPAGITTGAYTTSELATSTEVGSAVGPISIAVGGNTSYGGLTLASVGGYDDEFQGLTTMGPVEGITVSLTAATTTTSPTAATTTTSPILSTLTTTTGGPAATSSPISLTTVGADPVGLTIGTTSAIPSDVEQEPVNVYIVRPKTGIWRA